MHHEPGPAGNRSSIRHWCGLVLFFLLLSYVCTYCYLSRRGLAQAATDGWDSFVYVEIDERFTSADAARHYLLARVFAPLNWLDHQLFGTPGPVKCILTELA